MEFDDILLDVGDYGRYQLFILCGLCLPMCFFTGIQSFIQLFLSVPPRDYWCRVPELAEYNKTVKLLIGIPYRNGTNDFPTDNGHRHCYAYQHNYTDFFANISRWSESTNVSPQVACESGWEYEVDMQSVIPEWDLVCAHDWYPAVALLIFTLGSVCSLLIFGTIADFFGRKFALFSCLAVQVTFGTLSAFAPTFAIWCICRFLVGFSTPSTLLLPIIYALELVRPQHRTRVGILTSGSYSLGAIALAGFAAVLPEWRLLTLCMTVPEFALLFLWWFIPESPRWLLAQNRGDEVKVFLRYTARTNGHVIGSNTMNKLDLILDQENKGAPPSADLRDLFRLPHMRRKTILITCIWFSNISVYMGLSYYSPTLGGTHIYLSYLLSMGMEIPAYPVVWCLAEKYGRRIPLCLFMICSGVLCVVTVALPENNPGAIMAMYLLGKFCISASFFIIQIYACELYPTVVRGMGLGTSAIIATFGVCVGPIVIHLGKDYMTLPLAIFGVLAILAAFATLFLPETWHRTLPETLAEGEEFGKSTDMLEKFRADLTEPGLGGGLGTTITARMVTEKLRRDSQVPHHEVLSELNVENAEEEVVFDHVAHFRTFPNPGASKKQPLSRLNSARGLMSAQDPVY